MEFKSSNGVFAVLVLLFLTPAVKEGPSSDFETCALGPACVSLYGASCTTLGAFPATQVSYGNNLVPPGITAVMYDTVHNSVNQTVFYTTATISFTLGSSGSITQNGTVYLILFGLPQGNYSETIFLLETNGLILSPTVRLSCTL